MQVQSTPSLDSSPSLWMLRSRDPMVRDTIAYSVTATWIDRGALDEHLTALGDEMTARFDDPDIQARTFAPLILGEIVTRGAFDPTWLAAFIRWYRAETDIRGFGALPPR